MDTVPASEFTRNFGRYRMLAQREAVAVSSHGTIAGYFVQPQEYEKLLRFRAHRRVGLTSELSGEWIDAVRAAKVPEEFAHLDDELK
jgi:hypothetical protein